MVFSPHSKDIESRRKWIYLALSQCKIIFTLVESVQELFWWAWWALSQCRYIKTLKKPNILILYYSCFLASQGWVIAKNCSSNSHAWAPLKPWGISFQEIPTLVELQASQELSAIIEMQHFYPTNIFNCDEDLFGFDACVSQAGCGGSALCQKYGCMLI